MCECTIKPLKINLFNPLGDVFLILNQTKQMNENLLREKTFPFNIFRIA